MQTRTASPQRDCPELRISLRELPDGLSARARFFAVVTPRGLMLRLSAGTGTQFLTWKLGPRSVGRPLVGVARRCRFVVGLLGVGMLRQRRRRHRSQGGDRTNEDRAFDPHGRISFSKQTHFAKRILAIFCRRP